MEKKNPYKFTLGFDKTKPTHARAVEILNAVRDKADLIASAVVTHIDGGRTEEGAVLNQEALRERGSHIFFYPCIGSCTESM